MRIVKRSDRKAWIFMSRKKWLPMIGITILLCAACGKEQVPAVNQESTEEVQESLQQTTEESADPVQVRIYFSRIGEMGLESAEETLNVLRPENIISHLSLHNITSIDTKVNSFSEEKKNGKKILYLDLTKAYGEYVNTMNEQSEELILAALSKTFLEAYDADGLMLTVEGKPLTTAHQTYHAPLTGELAATEEERAEKEETAESVEYTVERKEMQEGEQLKIAYPVIGGLADADVEELFNRKITDYIYAMYDAENTRLLTCDYEITWQDETSLSVILRGSLDLKGNSHVNQFATAFNFDFVREDNNRLADLEDVEKIAEKLASFEDCELLGEISRNEFEEMLNKHFPNLSDSLSQFDFDFKNILLVTPGYSYQTEKGIGLILPLTGERWDYMEVRVNNL